MALGAASAASMVGFCSTGSPTLAAACLTTGVVSSGALGKLLMIYICNFHVLSHLLLIYICKLHWNLYDVRMSGKFLLIYI